MDRPSHLTGSEMFRNCFFLTWMVKFDRSRKEMMENLQDNCCAKRIWLKLQYKRLHNHTLSGGKALTVYDVLE